MSHEKLELHAIFRLFMPFAANFTETLDEHSQG